MIRIAYLIGELGKGGQERQLVYLLQSLEYHRYKAQLHVWDYKKDDRFVSKIPENVQIIGYPENGYKPLKLLKFILAVFFFRPHIIHSYAFYLNRLSNYIKPINWWGLATIGALRSSFHYMLSTKSEKLLASSFFTQDLIHTNSEKSKFDLLEFAKANNTNVDVCLIPNALDTGLFSCLNKPSNSSWQSISVGRMIGTKEFPAQIEIIKNLRKSGVDIKHQILGYGPEEKNIKEMVSREGLQDFIEVIESDSPVDFYCKADIFIQTSSTEGMPNCVMEAMSCGICCFATDVGDTGKLITNGQNGFLCEKNDFKGLEKLILNHLKKFDKSGIQQIGNEAAKTVRNKLSMQSNYRSIQLEYAKLLKRKK